MAVTNAQVLEALATLGVDPGPISLKGAQSTTFRRRVIDALAGTLGRLASPEQYQGGAKKDAINQATRQFDVALKIAAFKPSGGKSGSQSPLIEMLQLLNESGVISNQQYDQIFQQAKTTDLAEAVGHTLGWNNPAVKVAVQKAGVPITPRLQQFLDSAPQYGPWDPTKFMGNDTAGSPGAPAAAAPTAPAVAPLGPIPTDKAGIMNMQRLLNERGANLKVDGRNGPATQAAHAKYGRGGTTTVTASDPGYYVKAPGAPGDTLGQTLGGGQPPVPSPGAPPAGPVVPPLAANATDAQVEDYIRRNFGFAAWALKVPEIRGALVDFTKRMRGQDWTEDQLEAALMGTQWWQEHNDLARSRVVEKNEDPATYLRNIDGEMETLRERANQYGVNISDDRLRKIATDSYELGWGTAERNAAIGAEFDYNPETGAGDASIITQNLRGRARQNLLPLSEATIDKWGQNIIAGTATEETFDAYARQQAMLMFPIFSKQLEAGADLEMLLANYRESAAKYLEVDSESIDFTDPKFMRALQTRDKDGTSTVQTLPDFIDTIRTDASFGWDKTRNAREHAAKLAEDLAKTFGGV